MEKRDFIDRKIEVGVGGIERLFSLALKDMKTFILVISVCANIYLGHKVIRTNEEMRQAVIEEVRRQVPQEVRKETTEQLQGVNTKVDTVLSISNDIVKELKSKLDER